MENAAGKKIQCIIVTPERAVLDEAVDFVALPMIDGELGVLPGRAPLIGQLGYGELRTVGGGRTRCFYADGGFAQVRDNVVTVLTPRAIPAEEIKEEEAQKNLEASRGFALTPEAQQEQAKAQQRARAQVRIAKRGHH